MIGSLNIVLPVRSKKGPVGPKLQVPLQKVMLDWEVDVVGNFPPLSIDKEFISCSCVASQSEKEDERQHYHINKIKGCYFPAGEVP